MLTLVFDRESMAAENAVPAEKIPAHAETKNILNLFALITNYAPDINTGLPIPSGSHIRDIADMRRNLGISLLITLNYTNAIPRHVS